MDCIPPANIASKRYLSLAILTICLLLFVQEPLASQGPSGRTVAVVGGTLIDVSNYGHSTNDIADSVVLIRNGMIAAAGPASQISIPAGTSRIDARGKFVTPGLIDGFGAL